MPGGTTGGISFGTVPLLIRTEAFRWPRREADLHRFGGEAEHRVDLFQHAAERGNFGTHLSVETEDVGIVLHEAAHAHDAVQSAREFVAGAGSELGHADRQVAVALQAVLEDLGVAGAVHRFERKLAFFALGDKHVLLVLGPMAGTFPQGFRHH